MKIEAISVYGSAGTFDAAMPPKAIITAHIVIDDCATVEKAKALLGAAAEMQTALTEILKFSDDLPEHRFRLAAAALSKSMGLG